MSGPSQPRNFAKVDEFKSKIANLKQNRQVSPSLGRPQNPFAKPPGRPQPTTSSPISPSNTVRPSNKSATPPPRPDRPPEVELKGI